MSHTYWRKLSLASQWLTMSTNVQPKRNGPTAETQGHRQALARPGGWRREEGRGGLVLPRRPEQTGTQRKDKQKTRRGDSGGQHPIGGDLANGGTRGVTRGQRKVMEAGGGVWRLQVTTALEEDGPAGQADLPPAQGACVDERVTNYLQYFTKYSAEKTWSPNLLKKIVFSLKYDRVYKCI